MESLVLSSRVKPIEETPTLSSKDANGEEEEEVGQLLSCHMKIVL